MKTILILALISLLAKPIWARVAHPFRPAGIPANDPALNPPQEPELTPAELATPPAGKIQKSTLERSINYEP